MKTPLPSVSIRLIALFILAFCPLHASEEAKPPSKLGEIPVPPEIAAATKSQGPKRNDVIMRTLGFRKVPDGSEKDPFAAADTFYITRLDWTYLANSGPNKDHLPEGRQDDKKSVQRILDMGIAFGGSGADNFSCPLGVEETIGQQREREKTMAMLDLEGNPCIMPVTVKWDNPAYIADPSNPLWIQDNIDYYKYIIDCGATSLQRDNQNSDYFAVVRQGAGFSETAVKEFSGWLQKNLPAEELKNLGIKDVAQFDYREHLRAIKAPVGDDFAKFEEPIKKYWLNYWKERSYNAWEHIVKEVKAYAKSKGREVTFSSNNTSLQFVDPTYLLNDFLMSELLLGTADPGNLHARYRLARSHGKVLVASEPKPSGVDGYTEEQQTALTRRVIATTYSLGGICKVPWDTFLGSKDGAARHFGKAEDYADLYAFVRGNDWENYEEVGAVGPEIQVRSPELEQMVSIENGSGHVYGFLNRHRTDAQKPALLFLVDWGKPLVEPDPKKSSFTSPDGEVRRWGKGSENIKRGPGEPFTLVLNNALHVNPDQVEFVLLEPQPYNANLYVPASKVKDYGVFVKRTVLKPTVAENGQIRLDIPALNPWGILEIGGKTDKSRVSAASAEDVPSQKAPPTGGSATPSTPSETSGPKTQKTEFMDSAL
ncbi:MAG: hypothetical protein WEB60_02520 [Terrimicrobiaceae bacterium]